MRETMQNYYEKFTWDVMLNRYSKQKYDLQEYYNILCPKSDYPDFLEKYIRLPIMQRLKGIGLLCGTDWTPLYQNRIYYSRLDHSIGVALIIWHFTHNKAQTIAGLLHDISTPVFSHVSDFRKGDALTQTATEEPTAFMIKNNSALQNLLAKDGIQSSEVEDYHNYPIADNEIPCLSADRLEYMYPSGMGLDGSWTIEEIKRTYKNICVLKNEDGIEELGFSSLKIAEEYCEHFCMIGHILQLNENKLTLQMLGKIMSQAVEEKVLQEEDFMTLTESQVISKLDKKFTSNKMYKTFRTMTKIEHTTSPRSQDKYFNVNVKVKQRYINPLVLNADGKISRLYECSTFAKKIIDDFLSYEDTPYGCVRLR